MQYFDNFPSHIGLTELYCNYKLVIILAFNLYHQVHV